MALHVNCTAMAAIWSTTESNKNEEITSGRMYDDVYYALVLLC